MKPGIKRTVAGVLMLLVGVFAIPLVIILPLVSGKQHEVRFKAPGTAEATVSEPGRYYLWNHYRTLYDGKAYDRPEGLPDGLEIKIQDASGLQLSIVSDTSITTSSGGSSSKSVGYVEVGQPGIITIEVTGGSEERVLSFSQSRLLRIMGIIAGSIGLAVLTVVMGLIMIIWGVMKMANNKQG